MRKLRIDLSNKLTDYGVELLYRKLFDKNTEYNKAFFTSLEDIRKLRLYHSEGYVEPYKEECAVVDYEYIQFNYYYENLNDYTITKLVLEDEIDKILNIENQYISVNDPENYDSNVTCVMCRFVVSRNDNRPNSMNSDRRWIPVTVTDEGVKYIYEAWANLRNEKVNFFYTGNGEPNNTFENCHIMHLLDDVKVRDVQYWGRYCLLEGRKPFPYNTTTLSELGLGFYLKPHLYIRNYLATMDRNYAGDLFPIDRSYMENPNTLEYDHPVLALRLHEDDYICVWYSGKKATEEDETNFPNIAFSAKFYVNVIYGIWYDEDSIQWKDKTSQIIENKTFHYTETIDFDEMGMTPPPEYKAITTAYGNGTASLNYGNVSDNIASGFTGVLYKPIKVTTNGAYVTLYTRYITKNHITGGFWFNQTVTYSSKNFFLPNSRKYQLTCEHPTLGVITDFQEGTDFVCTTTITENDGVITYQEELKIPAGSRLRVLAEDFPNTYDTVGVFTTSYRQRNITFTEGVDYTQSPGSTSGDWWTNWYRFATVEGGRLYRAYATIYLVYQVPNAI